MSWGIGDFIGGVYTRRLGVLVVLFVSQPPTLLLIAVVVIARGVMPQPGLWMVAGVAAGLAGLVGLSAVYRGMAIGVISVVSTIAATGPVVPILVGLVLGERPTALQFFGMAMALGGIALLAIDRRPAASGRRLLPGVGLALVAALAFGLFLVAIRYASRPDPLWGVLATRAGSVSALLVLGLAMQTYGTSLPDQQEVLMHEADSLIDVFSAESAILRAAAATAAGVKGASLQVDAAHSIQRHTSPTGDVKFVVDPGSYLLYVFKDGYRPTTQTVTAGVSVAANIVYLKNQDFIHELLQAAGLTKRGAQTKRAIMEEFRSPPEGLANLPAADLETLERILTKLRLDAARKEPDD